MEESQEEIRHRRELYPPIEPYETGFIKVSPVHNLYYELCGNPNGKPVLFLHGGPGGGISAYNRQFFDPAAYRIILFEQRGSGRSTPLASLEDNTTWHLVDDIEVVRERFKVDRWVVFGGSWGSTLALAYASKHPERVKSLVLRGIFAVRRKELLWFYQEGASWIFPDAFEKFLEPIPLVERADMMGAYYRRLTGTNEEEKLRCAKAWSRWEMYTARLFVDPLNVKHAEEDNFALAFARIECHYFVHGGFLEVDDQILRDAAKKIKDIPGVIVQGRYDMCCPAATAWELAKVWPAGTMRIIPDSGHSAKEPGIVSELVKATDRFREL